MFSSSSRARPLDVASASVEGRIALARVLRMDRDERAGDTPVRLVRLLVVPRFGAAFEVETTNVTDLGMRRVFVPDEVVVVALEHAAPARVVILDAPPREWAALASSDPTVRTVPTAPSFDPPGGAVRAPSTGSRRPAALLFGVGGVIVVGLIVMAVAFVPGVVQSVMASGVAPATGIPTAAPAPLPTPGGATGAAPPEATATPEAPPTSVVADDHLTVEVVRAGLAQLEAVMGSTQAATLTLRRESISVNAPSVPGASTLDDFTFTGGTAERTGPSVVQLFPGETIERTVFDLTAFDPELVPGMLARASEATGIADPGLGTDPFDGPMIIVSRFAGTDATVQVLLQSDYGDGTVTFDLHGSVVSMDGGVPGSESWGANSN